MASKFQNAIAELRAKVALQGAETVARLQQIETSMTEKIDELKVAMKKGFEEAELALVAQTQQNVQNFDTLLDQLVELEERVARLEQRQPPAA